MRDPLIVALSPKPAAILSVMGSSAMLAELWMDLRGNGNGGGGSRTGGRSKSKRSKPLLRALAGICVGDVMSSSTWILSTFLFPRGTETVYGPAAFAVGNTGTCTAEGFFLQLGLGVALMSNTAHMAFSLLILRYHWRDYQIKRIEPYVHAVIWIVSLVLASYPLFLGLYNPRGDVCWIASLPRSCRKGTTNENDDYHVHNATSATSANSTATAALPVCERGSAYTDGLEMFMVIFPTWTSIVLSAICLFVTWRTVLTTEIRQDRYQFAPGTTGSQCQKKRGNQKRKSKQQQQQQHTQGTVTPHGVGTERRELSDGAAADSIRKSLNLERSRMFKHQAIAYMAALLGAYGPGLVNYFLITVGGIRNRVLDHFFICIEPAQGIFNFLVFSRNRTHMKTRWGTTLRSWLCWGTLCCNNNQNSRDEQEEGDEQEKEEQQHKDEDEEERDRLDETETGDRIPPTQDTEQMTSPTNKQHDDWVTLT